MEVKSETKTASGKPSGLPVRWLITALIVVQASALGLKAWEERQTADQFALSVLQRTSVAATERLEGQFNSVGAALSAAISSAQLSRVTQNLETIDIIVPLREAAQAEAGTRLRLAADEALRVGGSESVLATTPTGDIVIVHRQPGRAPVLAIGPATNWLPGNASPYAFSFSGPGKLASGNTVLADIPIQRPAEGTPYFQSTAGHPRTAVACNKPDFAAVSLCVMSDEPLFGRADLLRLVIYGLLLLAPALAIYGLYKSLSGKSRRLEAALKTEQEAAHIFDLVMEGAQAGFWETDVESCTADISDRFAKLMGAPNGGNIHADDFMNYVYEDDRPLVRQAFERGREIGMINIAFRTAHNGGRSWIELTGRRVEGSAEPNMRCAGIAADITARKAIDERLKTAERRLRNALEGYDGPFAIWDARKRLLYWNSAYASTFNLTQELRAGMSHETVTLARAPSIRQETPSPVEPNTHLIQLATNRWINLVERTTPEGGLISIGIDITETQQSANQLDRQSKKLKRLVTELERSEGHAAELARKYAEEKDRAERAAHSKSTFLANMSHELRTPLNAINGFSEILTKELYGPLGDGRYKGYANDILMSGQHLLDMINDILDMAKIEAGKMSIQRQPIDPIDPVDAAVRMIGRRAEDANIRLLLDTEDDLPEIEADHRAIRQMMLNLISNAIKFTDSGGRIAVTVRQRDNYVRFAVTDTGVGIPETDLPRLAQPFEQVNSQSNRNYEGTGLGLALTKSFR